MDECILAENNGIQVYDSDIQFYCDEYINSLPDENMVYKPMVFTGMLEYLYTHCIKQLLNREKYGSIDYELLDHVFQNIYKPLCYKYNNTPKIITFCCLVRIDSHNLGDVKNGVLSNGHERISKNDTTIVKKWYDICESGLVEKTVENNGIGSMFLLKAKYGYRDNDNVLTIQTRQTQHESAAEIAARYSSASLPEKPQLDE